MIETTIYLNNHTKTANKEGFQDDVGIVIRYYAKIDLSTIDTIVFKVEKPSSEIVTWTAAKASDNDYYAVYTIVADDLDEYGLYKVTLYLTDGTSIYTGQTDTFTIHERFRDFVAV